MAGVYFSRIFFSKCLYSVLVISPCPSISLAAAIVIWNTISRFPSSLLMLTASKSGRDVTLVAAVLPLGVSMRHEGFSANGTDKPHAPFPHLGMYTPPLHPAGVRAEFLFPPSRSLPHGLAALRADMFALPCFEIFLISTAVRFYRVFRYPNLLRDSPISCTAFSQQGNQILLFFGHKRHPPFRGKLPHPLLEDASSFASKNFFILTHF